MSNAYFDKRLERIKQKLGILYARPDFQADVLEFRKTWNIPQDGIKTEDENHDWRIWLNEETNKYVDQYLPEHRKQAQELFNQNKLIERDDLNRAFNNKVPRNAFRLQVLGFLKKYKIPSQWEEITRRYLLFNKEIEPHIPLNSVTLQENWDFDIGSWQLSLLLSADSTLEDIKAIWPLVKEQQSKLYDYSDKKFQPIPNLEIDKKVYELKQKKSTYARIAEEVNKEFPHLSYTYKDVGDSLRRHKKRLGIL